MSDYETIRVINFATGSNTTGNNNTISNFVLRSDVDQLVFYQASKRTGNAVILSKITIDPGGTNEIIIESGSIFFNRNNGGGATNNTAFAHLTQSSLPPPGTYDVRFDYGFSDETFQCIFGMSGLKNELPTSSSYEKFSGTGTQISGSFNVFHNNSISFEAGARVGAVDDVGITDQFYVTETGSGALNATIGYKINPTQSVRTGVMEELSALWGSTYAAVVFPPAKKPQQDFYTQRGTVRMGSTSGSATITAGIDYVKPRKTDRAWIRISGHNHVTRGSSAAFGGPFDINAVFIKDPENLFKSITFIRGDAASVVLDIDWEIIEYVGPIGGPNEIKVINTGVALTPTNGTGSQTTATEIPVDPTRVVPFITSQGSGDNTTSWSREAIIPAMHTAWWNSSSNNVITERHDGVQTSVPSSSVSIEAVEFIGPNWTITQIDHSFSGTSDEDETVSVSDVNKTMLHVQTRASGNVSIPVSEQFGQKTWLVDNTTLRFNTDAYEGSRDSRVWLIENSDPSFNITRYFGVWSASADDPDSLEIPLNAAVDLSQSSVGNVSSTINSTADDTNQLYLAAVLNDTGSVTLHRGISDELRDYQIEVVEWPYTEVQQSNDTHVGSFNITTDASGSKVPVYGFGFRPSAILFWWSGRTLSSGSESALDDAHFGIGCATSTTDRFSLNTFSENVTEPSITRRRQFTEFCVSDIDSSGSLIGAADVSSIDDDGFTLMISSSFTTDLIVSYLALGGDHNAKTGFIPAPGTGTFTETGIGFHPQCVLFFPTWHNDSESGASGSQSLIGVGAAVSSSKQWHVTTQARDGVSPSTRTVNYAQDVEIMAGIQADGVNQRVSFTSLDPDGFTLDVTEQNNHSIFYLALAGGRYHIGNFDIPTDSSESFITGSSFIPSAILLSGIAKQKGAVDTVLQAPSASMISIGAASSLTNTSAQTWGDEDSRTFPRVRTSVEHNYVYIKEQMVNLENGGPDGLMKIVSFNEDGVSIKMDKSVDETAFVGYVMFGSAVKHRSSLVGNQEGIVPIVRYPRFLK